MAYLKKSDSASINRERALAFVLARLDDYAQTELLEFVNQLSQNGYEHRQNPVSSVWWDEYGERVFARVDYNDQQSHNTIAMIVECALESGLEKEDVSNQLTEVPSTIYENLSYHFTDQLSEYVLSDYTATDPSDEYSFYKVEILKILIAYALSKISISQTFVVIDALLRSSKQDNAHSPMHFIRLVKDLETDKKVHSIDWLVQLL